MDLKVVEFSMFEIGLNILNDFRIKTIIVAFIVGFAIEGWIKLKGWIKHLFN